ncbi:hypothetical protein AVEN_88287-1 [Araneus ventricosus]|uniref:Transposase Tc1-like domain-containing protein n=1 Tax=Araneus ventricosus TaxID=182803 RepID=A0A4Y2EQ02_ARAVE|nr:hypothetical protein AVEN_88287-1 [Araneus ventricosus]
MCQSGWMSAQLLSSTMRLFSSHMKRITSRSRILDKLFVRMFFKHCNLSDTVGVWKCQVVRDRRATLLHIAADFNDEAFRSVSMQTVQRTVINMGSQSLRPTRLLLLTARHNALLLSWARQHYHWTVDDWKHVAWSDESRFQLYRNPTH